MNTPNNINKNKSFLRWAGSKKKLLPVLKNECVQPFNKYLEPFVGSGQLYFSVNPNKAILSDTNKNLIDCYNAIKEKFSDVYSNLAQFPLGKENYYNIRKDSCTNWNNEKKAARFLYLNTFCFNGLYRTNKSGEFNVPYSESSGELPSFERLKSISENLKNAEFLCGDFENIIKKCCEKGDLVYLDPPYAIKNKDIFVQYGPETFGISDLVRLSSTLTHIDSVGAKFILSYALCDESLEIAKDWNHKKVMTVRNISGFAQHRKQEQEVIISNFTLND